MTPDAVAIARGWIGTPYHHQARTKGSGADCLGLILGVWEELLGPLPEAVPPYSADWSEPQRDEVLWRAATRHLASRALVEAGRGDVILFRMRQGSVAKHLGIQSRIGDGPAFIHAYSGHGVVESPLSAPWARRIVARFAFPI